MMQIAMEKKGNIMFFPTRKLREIENIDKYFEIKPEGKLGK